VIQFKPASSADFDELIALEDRLRETLGDAVDGHDLGEGECNIFILKDVPAAALRSILPACRSSALFPRMKATFRALDEEFYTSLWPQCPS
jgi:hypothetical protein